MPAAVASRPKPKKKAKKISRRIFKPPKPLSEKKVQKKLRKLLGKSSAVGGVAKGKAVGFIEERLEEPIAGVARMIGAGVVSGVAGSMLASDAVKLSSFGLRKGIKVWKEKKQKKAMVDVLSRCIGNPRYAKAVSDDIGKNFGRKMRTTDRISPTVENLFEGTQNWDMFRTYYRQIEIDAMLDAAARARIKKGLSLREIRSQRRKLAKEIYEEFLHRYVFAYGKRKPKTKHLEKIERKRQRAERLSESNINRAVRAIEKDRPADPGLKKSHMREAVLEVMAEPFLSIKERKAKIREIKEAFKKEVKGREVIKKVKEDLRKKRVA